MPSGTERVTSRQRAPASHRGLDAMNDRAWKRPSRGEVAQDRDEIGHSGEFPIRAFEVATPPRLR
jgi:hypothetical protein